MICQAPDIDDCTLLLIQYLCLAMYKPMEVRATTAEVLSSASAI